MTDERDLLRQAEEALRAVGKAAIVVKPTLNQPYPDAPDQTPWSRFMEEPARRAYNLGQEIRTYLKAYTLSPGDRVEWNTTGDEWEPGTVATAAKLSGHFHVRLDDNNELVLIDAQHLRPLGGAAS